MNVLEVTNVNKKIGKFKVENISFSLPKGYIMGFVGRNGAGKTTIMNLILNRYVKKKGKILIEGIDNVKQEKRAKSKIGFVMDVNPFINRLTLRENANLYSTYYDEFSFKTFNNYLERFQLSENKKLEELSKGMKIKFQLAFALSHKASLLILDEPTGGLDPIFRREFLSILQELVETEEISILFSTHITSDLDKVADYITMVDQGKIVFSLEREELQDKYRIIKGSKDDLRKLDKGLFQSVISTQNGFEGLTEHYEVIMDEYGAKGVLLIERPTIEDIMYHVSKGGKNNVEAISNRLDFNKKEQG